MLTGKALVIIASIISAGFGMGIAVLGGALGEGNAVSRLWNLWEDSLKLKVLL
jgi:F0F1-type ATP synthase membrane subunit c/vacuolar-type H+-ATPase subunit K